jgi:selenocysteine lyase/cysteine desulfurase
LNNRRDFIRTGFLAIFGLSSSKILRGSEELPLPIGDEYESLFNIKSGFHYLNTGTLGLSPIRVQEKFIETIRSSNSDGSYNNHEDELMQNLAKYLNSKTENLCLSKNVTESMNIAIWSLPLNAGDEIILSTHEHAGSAIPWLNRARRDQLKIKLIELGSNGSETLSNIKNAIGPKTRVISIPHIPCTIGRILPLKEICALAREHSIYSVIDGAHGPGMLQTDLEDMKCDMYAGCFHKWLLGPKGLGFLYINSELLPNLETNFAGEHTLLDWSFENAQAESGRLNNETTSRYYNGTKSDPQMAAANEALLFHMEFGTDKIEAEIRKRSKFLLTALKEMKEIELLTSTNPDEIGGIVSFRVKGHNYVEIKDLLSKKSFRLRIVPESGIDCIRVSTHIYNSMQEIELFASSLRGLVR